MPRWWGLSRGPGCSLAAYPGAQGRPARAPEAEKPHGAQPSEGLPPSQGGWTGPLCRGTGFSLLTGWP